MKAAVYSFETSINVYELHGVTSDRNVSERELYVKGKAFPVIGRGGRKGCETSRLPHFLDSRHKDGGEVVSRTHRLPFNPRKIPGTYFC
jgi:hypothetical protein